MGADRTDRGAGALTRDLDEIGVRAEAFDLRLSEMLDPGLDARAARACSHQVRQHLSFQGLPIACRSLGELLSLFR